MNTQPDYEPDFRQYIQAGRREAAEAARSAAVAEQQARAENLRAGAVVLDVLENVVRPLLTAAQEQLHEDQITADLGNGKDAYGNKRYSLRISHAATLVFTADTQGLVPCLGFHREDGHRSGGYIPKRIQDTDRENLNRIIGEFIKDSFHV
jgi:hypothetical protein